MLFRLLEISDGASLAHDPLASAIVKLMGARSMLLGSIQCVRSQSSLLDENKK